MGFVRVALLMPLLLGTWGGCDIPPPPPLTAPTPSASASSVVAAPAAHADPSLLPRAVLLAPPDRSDVKVSPNGQQIGWLASVNGVANVWIAPADNAKKAVAITDDATHSVLSWWWAFGSDRVVFSRETKSDEPHLYVVDVAKKDAKDLTAVEGVHAELVGLSSRLPREALVGLNERDKKFEDVYAVDLFTGARRIVQENNGGFASFWADDDLRVRYALKENADGSKDIVQPGRGKQPSTPLLHVPVEDSATVTGVGFDRSGGIFYLKDSRGRDTSALVALDTKTGKTTVVAQDPHTDVGQILLHPTANTVEAVSFDYERRAWTVVDASVEGDFYYLQTFGDGALQVTSRSLDEQRWIVAYSYPDGPTAYYRYDRDPDVAGDPGKATFLFKGSDALDHAKLATMTPVVVKARDGLDLVSYLTLPMGTDPRDEGRPKAPLPLVVVVHDGPWSRVHGEDTRQHQWLASRGYAALSVNYRGSTGFGKRFVEAANLQWGARMEDDLLDAVKWAIDEKIADPDNIAIMGTGYGGYAALVAMTTAPDEFACAIDIGGPTNLESFMENMPPYLQARADEFARRIGDWRTDDGKKLLLDRSPLTHVKSARHPLLIEQGKNDPRVLEAETAKFVEATKRTRAPVTYVVYADEGRTLSHGPDRASFDAIAEAFLAECLDGPYQPFGQDLAGANFTVPVGAQYVHGLHDAAGHK